MMWPFKTEVREGYSEALLGLMLSSAQGTAKADPRLTGGCFYVCRIVGAILCGEHH